MQQADFHHHRTVGEKARRGRGNDHARRYKKQKEDKVVAESGAPRNP
jgi:hypothetical protein